MSKEDKTSKEKQGKKPTPKPPAKNQKTNIPFDYDTFWLNYIKEETSKTITKLDAKFKSYLTFIDTLSFTTFLGGIGLTTYLTSTNPWVFLLIFSPIIFLQYAKYKLKVEIDKISLKTVEDMRNPIQIHEAHNELIKEAKEKLDKGKPWVKNATIMYLLCIPLGIFIHNYESSLEIVEYCKISLEDSTINIDAQIPNSINHFIEIKGKSNNTQMDTVIKMKVTSNDKLKFDVHYHTELLKMHPKEVSIKYTQNKQLKSYKQKVKKAIKEKEK